MKGTLPYSLIAAVFIVGSVVLALGHYTRRPMGVDADEIAVNLSVIVEEPEDLVPFMPTHCEVHHIEMKIDVVPIRYGEPAEEPRLKRFPHGAAWSLGGCCILWDSPRTARVRICPECERGFQASEPGYSDIGESEKRYERQ